MHVPSFASGVMLVFALGGSVAATLADDLREVTRLHQAGQSAAALERADRYLATQPKDAQMRFLKSVVLADSARPAEAQTLLQQLVEDFPELAEPHNNLAALYAAAGNYGKARAALEEALRLNPAYVPAHENLGDVHIALAGQAYALALRLEPASATLPRKISLLRQLGEAAVARPPLATSPAVSTATPSR